MRFLVDSNIPAAIVAVLRSEGHDVEYLAERPNDPGKDGMPHSGVILVDDLGDPAAENALVSGVVRDRAVDLAQRAFIRVSVTGVRIG